MAGRYWFLLGWSHVCDGFAVLVTILLRSYIPTFLVLSTFLVKLLCACLIKKLL